MIDLSTISFEKEDGLATSSPVFIPAVKAEMEIWIDTESAEFPAWSEKQKRAFLDVEKVNKIEWGMMQHRLEQLYADRLKKNEILPFDSENGEGLYDLDYRAAIIPKQSVTENLYFFLLADTHWRIADSEFVLEIEILFRNTEFELLQEYSGLWTRLEWPEFYNCPVWD